MRRRPIRKRLAAAAFAASLIAAAPAAADPGGSARAIANFNVPDGGVAEIVSATPDGRTLLYTDAGGQAIGVVDIADPAAPAQVARIAMPGEPTSVAVTGDGARALVAVNTSVREEGAPPVLTPGRLVVIDIATRTIAAEVEIGVGPDSMRVTRIDGVDVAVVAIENEPVVVDADGNLTDGEDPGLPGDVSGPGLVQVVAFEAGGPRVIDVPLAPLAERLLFPDDPQPEFVSIRGARAAISLQENNGVAIVDVSAALAGGDAVERVFSVGTARNRPADLADDDTIAFRDRYPADIDPAEQPAAGARMPDAVAWSADGRTVFTADEGEQDFTGGRGWSAHDAATGRTVWEDTQLERTAARFGHYPDGRSDAKGIEVEGIATATVGRRQLAYVGSERGSFLAVYDVSRPRAPRFLQLLPTGVEPEGILPIPSRDLVVTSAEGTGNLTILQGVDEPPGGTATRPQIVAAGTGTTWAALSGLAGDPSSASVVWAVPDNALPSDLYRIRVDDGVARLTARPIRKDGAQARYDLEGIAALERGFWLASEGNAAFGEDDYRPNLLVEVAANGRVLREIALPAGIDSATGGVIRSNGFEGVAVSDSGRYVLAAVQREYAGDAVIGGVRHTRIARHDLLTGEWDFFLYPLDAPPPGASWVGLSEIVNLGGDRYAVIERDNAAGGAAAVKRVYEFTLDGVEPTDGAPLAPDAEVAGKVIGKTLLRDVLEESAPFEKLEGLAVTTDGRLWSAVDNDGGRHESRLSDLGIVEEDVSLWLSLLHSNDGESKLLGSGDSGGAARFATVVERLRSASAGFGARARTGALTISSGDNFLAGPEFNASLEKGVPFYDSIALDRIGFDALTIGNHEFDFGPDVLADVIEGAPATGPWLSANLDVSAEPALAALADGGRIAPSAVLEVGGTRVAVIGATTERLRSISSPEDVVVNQVLPAVQAEVARHRADGVDIIILSSHLQSIEEDEALAPLLSGVDIMIAGGGGELLANGDDLLQPADAEDGPSRPYPVLVTDADGKQLPIVTTSGDYAYVGRLIAGFDADGELVRINDESGPVRVIGGDVPDAAEPDAVLQRRVVEPVRAAVDALAANVVASTEVRLSGIRAGGVRTQETNLGNLVADALLFEGRRAAAGLGVAEPVVAIQNGGGIRNNDVFPADLASGVTELDTFRVLPFSNFVAIVPDVSRATLTAILENAVSRVEFVDGRFAQVAGLRFTWDAAAPAGSRVTEVVLDDGTAIVSGGAVVDGPPVSVATIDFLVNGGDDYPFGAPSFARSTVTYQQALLNYLVAPAADGGLGGAITAADYPEVPSPGDGARIDRVN
jgi:2',3'-cyclic-nucleotide 2'-phosphodiesterase (5'-nucleotidase family)